MISLLVCDVAHAKTARILHGKDVLEGSNIHDKIIPASVQKITTMYLAWNILGPNYRFKTQLTKISANMHYQLSFSFDPSLNDKDLIKLLKNLPTHTKINLDIVSNGLTQPHHPLWDKDDLRYCYAAPLGPAILNQNCKLENKVIKVGRSNISAQSTKKRPHTKQIFTTKNISVSSPFQAYANMPAHIKVLARKHNVKIDKIKWVMHAQPGKIIAVHTSEPLTKLMYKGLKNSNNLIMDALWLASAQKLEGNKRITWQQSASILMTYLRTKHPNWGSSLYISDGSGLSIHNRVSISTLNLLLQTIEKNEQLHQWSMNAFPTAASDGTMKNRFHRYKQHFKNFTITAKTGTLKNVRNYCGWITRNNGTKLRFIWIENADRDKQLTHKHIQEDAIMKFISPHMNPPYRKHSSRR